MGWVTAYNAKLKNGETVLSVRHSVKGKIESGHLCTVEPIADFASLQKDHTVLCKMNGDEYLHLIKAIQDSRFQIGNNRGRINGWISAKSLFGKCVKVDG